MRVVPVEAIVYDHGSEEDHGGHQLQKVMREKATSRGHADRGGGRPHHQKVGSIPPRPAKDRENTKRGPNNERRRQRREQRYPQAEMGETLADCYEADVEPVVRDVRVHEIAECACEEKGRSDQGNERKACGDGEGPGTEIGDAPREEHPRLAEDRQGCEREEKSGDDARRRYALAEDQEAEGVPTVYDRRLVIKEISVGDITSQ